MARRRGFFGRVRDFTRRVFGRRSAPPPPPPPPPPGGTGLMGIPGDDELPEGFHIVSLHWEGEQPHFPRSFDDLQDEDIAGADAIRVAYTDPDSGITYYRTIHGARSKEALIDLMLRIMFVVSPK